MPPKKGRGASHSPGKAQDRSSASKQSAYDDNGSAPTCQWSGGVISGASRKRGRPRKVKDEATQKASKKTPAPGNPIVPPQDEAQMKETSIGAQDKLQDVYKKDQRVDLRRETGAESLAKPTAMVTRSPRKDKKDHAPAAVSRRSMTRSTVSQMDGSNPDGAKMQVDTLSSGDSANILASTLQTTTTSVDPRSGDSGAVPRISVISQSLSMQNEDLIDIIQHGKGLIAQAEQTVMPAVKAGKQKPVVSLSSGDSVPSERSGQIIGTLTERYPQKCDKVEKGAPSRSKQSMVHVGTDDVDSVKLKKTRQTASGHGPKIKTPAVADSQKLTFTEKPLAQPNKKAKEEKGAKNPKSSYLDQIGKEEDFEPDYVFTEDVDEDSSDGETGSMSSCNSSGDEHESATMPAVAPSGPIVLDSQPSEDGSTYIMGRFLESQSQDYDDDEVSFRRPAQEVREKSTDTTTDSSTIPLEVMEEVKPSPMHEPDVMTMDSNDSIPLEGVDQSCVFQDSSPSLSPIKKPRSTVKRWNSEVDESADQSVGESATKELGELCNFFAQVPETTEKLHENSPKIAKVKSKPVTGKRANKPGTSEVKDQDWTPKSSKIMLPNTTKRYTRQQKNSESESAEATAHILTLPVSAHLSPEIGVEVYQAMDDDTTADDVTTRPDSNPVPKQQARHQNKDPVKSPLTSVQAVHLFNKPASSSMSVSKKNVPSVKPRSSKMPEKTLKKSLPSWFDGLADEAEEEEILPTSTTQSNIVSTSHGGKHQSDSQDAKSSPATTHSEATSVKVLRKRVVMEKFNIGSEQTQTSSTTQEHAAINQTKTIGLSSCEKVFTKTDCVKQTVPGQVLNRTVQQDTSKPNHAKRKSTRWGPEKVPLSVTVQGASQNKQRFSGGDPGKMEFSNPVHVKKKKVPTATLR